MRNCWKSDKKIVASKWYACVYLREREDNAFGRLSVGLSRVCRDLVAWWMETRSLYLPFFLNPEDPVHHPFSSIVRARSRLTALFHSALYKVTPRDRQFLAPTKRDATHARGFRNPRRKRVIICYSQSSLSIPFARRWPSERKECLILAGYTLSPLRDLGISNLSRNDRGRRRDSSIICNLNFSRCWILACFAFGRTFRGSRSSGLRGTYLNILMVHAPCIKETRKKDCTGFCMLSAGTKCKMKERGVERGGGGGSERGKEDGRRGDDEALIEFESARIIVKRLKRPETNLFASESFLVEDNKWSAERPPRKLRHKSFSKAATLFLPLFCIPLYSSILAPFVLSSPRFQRSSSNLNPALENHLLPHSDWKAIVFESIYNCPMHTHTHIYIHTDVFV